MKKSVNRIFAVILVVLMAAVTVIPTVSALEFKNGQEIGTGHADSVINKDLGGGLTYSKATFVDSGNLKQAVNALEFNPKTSGYMPYVYSRWTGTGAIIGKGRDNAKAQFGTELVAGVNATFFAMNTGSTYYGYWVRDGKLAQADNMCRAEIVTFDSKGNAAVVQSYITTDLYVNGQRITVGGSSPAIGYINKRPLKGTATDKIYFWDTECGTKADSSVAGTEVLCKKLNGGDISIGRTLEAQVVSVTNDAMKGTIAADEFILYAKNGTELQEKLASFSKGDYVHIVTEENNKEAKPYTEQAVTAFAGQYSIIRDGKYNPGADTKSLDHYNQRAQRTSFGVKADGTVVLVASPGRKATDDASGLTIPELGKIMLQLGCKFAYNLDGGGSTQMYYTEDGKVVDAIASSRAVANCLYIAKRPELAEEKKALAAKAAAMDGKYLAADAVAAIAAAKAVAASDKTMAGDIVKSNMDLDMIVNTNGALETAIAASLKITPYDYSITALNNIRKSYAEAMKLLNDAKAEAKQKMFAGLALNTALAAEGDIAINVTAGKKYENTAYAKTPHYASGDNYGDSGFELTDGIISNVNDAYGPNWVAFTVDKPYTGKISVEGKDRRYYDIIIDLEKKYDNIKDFNTFTEYYSSSGIDYCIAVDYAVSDDKVNWTEVGRASRVCDEELFGTKYYGDIEYPLHSEEGVSGKYIRVRYIAAGTTHFIFTSEIQAFSYESTLTDIGYVTAFNKSVANNDAVIYTYDMFKTVNGKNANTNWTQVVVVDKVDGAYVVTETYTNPGSKNVEVNVPENGFVYSVHTDQKTPSSMANRAFAEALTKGTVLALNGIDLAKHEFLPGAYMTSGILASDAEVTVKNTNILVNSAAFASVEEFKKQFADPSAVEVGSKRNVGTGTKVTYRGSSFTVILKGDVTGDGKVTAADAVAAKKYVLGVGTANEDQVAAMRLVSGIADDKKPTARVALELKKHTLGLTDIFKNA